MNRFRAYFVVRTTLRLGRVKFSMNVGCVGCTVSAWCRRYKRNYHSKPCLRTWHMLIGIFGHIGTGRIHQQLFFGTPICNFVMPMLILHLYFGRNKGNSVALINPSDCSTFSFSFIRLHQGRTSLLWPTFTFDGKNCWKASRGLETCRAGGSVLHANEPPQPQGPYAAGPGGTVPADLPKNLEQQIFLQ